MLEPVEDLFERKLHARKYATVAASDAVCASSSAREGKECSRGGNQKRQMRHNEGESNQSAHDSSDSDNSAARTDSS